ncbi:uncharacterized protein LOC121962265 [Plectropomus leopardus]|uniref:uncharacterized protein LOC121962265 n=1 Tax=Plectropomus leopardus TaxID=160734 RepID=UPI001C4D0A99|nr:uncharacterized protein LOC121962265 [Plectropomus leopardus]
MLLGVDGGGAHCYKVPLHCTVICTMRKLNLITVLLHCSLGWFSVSVSQSQTVEAQSGEDVTLLCSNFSSSPTQIMWFRVVKRSQPRCVAFMLEPLEHKLCNGFQKGKFEMRSNLSTVFLKIKQANSSDSGLYFCGFFISRKPLIMDAIYLEVQEAFDGMAEITNVILGSLMVVFVVGTLCLAVKFRKLQKAHAEEQHPQRTESQGSDDLNYAAVTFHPKRNLPASKRKVEPNAIYSATR